MQKIDFIKANRFARLFLGKSEKRLRSDKNSRLLKSILEFEILQCNQNFRIEDFKEYFYFDNTFKKSYKELNKAIDESDFIYLHSYGKNGKSTFIEMFINFELTKKKYSTYFYDFRAKPNYDHLSDHLIDVDSFYWDYLADYRDVRINENPIVLFFKYLIDHFDHDAYRFIKDQYIKRNILQYYNLAKAVIGKVSNFSKTDNGIDVLNESIFVEELSLIIIEEFKFKGPDANKMLGYVLLNILVATKVFYAIKYTSDRKVLFFLDNLDDVHTYLPEEINISYTANIINFIRHISLCYSDVFCETENGTHIDPTFIFVYRTSNYLSTLSEIYEQDDSQRSRINFFDEDSVRRVRITSVKDSFKIISKRLDFYKLICDHFDITYSPRYELIHNIIASFFGLDDDYESKFDPSTILRLWNGNKLSFSRFVTRVEFSEKDLNLLLHKNVSKRIKSEIFFHYFIQYFSDKSVDYSPFSKFLNYSFSSFNNDIADRRCSLSRLFFTYIHNRRHDNREIKTIQDAFVKGISLNDFMNDIKQIKVAGKPAYSEEDIQEMFEKLFAFEIDNWGNFFSCCAPTKGYSNSSKEHYKWTGNTIRALKNPEERRKVRFFDNDSAPYFMFKVKRSFEYFSFNSSKVTTTLPASISYTMLKGGAASAPYRMILNRVYTRVEEVCEITFEFFTKSFRNVTANEYCNSYWSYNNRMYFDDLISKIVDYIEQTRIAVINGHVLIGGDYPKYEEEVQMEILKDINTDFAENIMKYIHLFYNYYNRLLDRDKKLLDSDVPERLKSTALSFKTMRVAAEQVINTPGDFTVEIKSKKHGR